MTYNQKPVTITIQRIELCDMLLACGAMGRQSGAEKWEALHGKLNEMLEEFDKQNGRAE